MGRNHLKRLAIPRSWKLKRKETKYIIRQAPGAHPIEHSLPLSVVLREHLGIAKSAREVRYVLQQREVLIDGKRRREEDFAVGPMDVIAIPALKQQFRMIVKSNGTLHLLPIDEGEMNKKLCRVAGKRMRNTKQFQLTLSDGRSITSDAKDIKVGDSLLLELPDQKVAAQYPLADGAAVYLFGGTHCGQLGTVERISGNMVHIQSGDGQFQTPKEYVFVVGKGKPVIQVSANG